AVAIVVIAGVTGFVIYNNDIWTRAPGGHIPAEIAQRSALMRVIDTANRNSGIESGAVFNYELADRQSNATNFGILLCSDEARCDSVVSREVAVWRQPNSPSDDTAEIDTQTHHVVSFHRDIPDFAADGNYGEQELENRARQFLAEVYPEFAGIESNLTFAPGMKETRLNNGNYFYRWNDEQFALPTGLSTDVPPFVQIGINAGGFIFSYTNTLPLYNKPMRHDLQTLCGYVEMPPTDDSSISPEEKIVRVHFDEYEPVDQGKYLLLPYEPETDFEGCSESAKEFLRHLPNPYD
ncbi:MAG: hypothetical protein L0287_20200, partial [Anaerolineae bacterium]|nr:hypothetical protein [Anaerolineae bacterium]